MVIRLPIRYNGPIVKRKDYFEQLTQLLCVDHAKSAY